MSKHIQIILFFLIISVLSKAQIPNNSFESWTTTSGYETPDNWGNLNPITYNSGIYTCMKGSPGYSGASYLFLISKTIPGKGVVPGIAVCGEIDTITYKPKSGIPFSSRPQNLSYFMQFMPYDQSDSSSVKILLTKWDQTQLKRDTIAYGASYYNSMSHTWFYNDTYLNYYSENTPDSAIIVISSSSSDPKVDSYIYIDNLQFNGNIIGIDENESAIAGFSISPNPTNRSFTIEYRLSNNEDVRIVITDVLGRIIYTSDFKMQISGTHQQEINLILQSGIYNIMLITKNSIANKKVIINK